MQFEDIVENFKGKHILVIGDLMLDRYIKGKVSRVSPEAPVPVVDVLTEYSLPGGAANVVNNLNVMGANVLVAGVVCDDTSGKNLIHILEEKGVIVKGIIIDNSRPTTVKTRIIAQNNQQLIRIDNENRDEISSDICKAIIDYATENIEIIDAILISDYAKGVITSKLMEQLVKLAKEHDKIINVDPKPGNFSKYRGISVITPNQREASEITNVDVLNETSLRNIGFNIMAQLECEAVLITRGKDGIVLLDSDGKFLNVPSVAQEVFDVTGAGDTVISVFTLALSAGASLEEAVALSNYAASIVVKKVGTATVSPKELLKFLKHLNNNDE